MHWVSADSARQRLMEDSTASMAAERRALAAFQVVRAAAQEVSVAAAAGDAAEEVVEGAVAAAAADEDNSQDALAAVHSTAISPASETDGVSSPLTLVRSLSIWRTRP